LANSKSLENFVGGSCAAQGSPRELAADFLGMAPPKPQVKPEHGQNRAESPHIGGLGIVCRAETRAKTAQIWVKRYVRIRWMLAPAIFACSAA